MTALFITILAIIFWMEPFDKIILFESNVGAIKLNDIITMAGATIAAIIATFKILTERDIRRYLPLLPIIALILFVLYWLITFSWFINGKSIIALGRMVCGVGLIFSTTVFLKEKHIVWLFLPLCILSILFFPFAAIYLGFGDPDMVSAFDSWYDVNKNSSALILCSIIAWLIWVNQQKQLKWIFPLITLIFLLQVYISSRAGIVATLTMIFYMLFKPRSKYIAIAQLCLAACLPFVIFFFESNTYPFMTPKISNYFLDTSSFRVAMIDYAWSVFYQSPIWGKGLSYLNASQIELASVTQELYSAHSNYLNLAAEGGLISLLLFNIFFFSVAARFFFIENKRPTDDLKNFASLLCIIIFIHGLFEYDLLRSRFWILMGVVFAIGRLLDIAKGERRLAYRRGWHLSEPCQHRAEGLKGI